MFLEVENVLSPDDLISLREIAKSATFVDGRVSAPNNPMKNNEQVDMSSEAFKQSSNIVGRALQASEQFRNYAFVKQFAPPMLCQYGPGMTYGAHPDSAYIFVPGRMLRSDVSCTVFISDPDEYEGGALRIHIGERYLDVKLKAGSAVVYPSTTIHEVRPVEKGNRLVAITFIESQISDETQRELLYTLNEVAALEGMSMEWDNRIKLEHVRHRLHRMFSS